MELSQLFEALEENPTDFQAFDALQAQCLEAGDQENLERAYTSVLHRLEETSDLEQVLRRIEMKTRTASDPDLQLWMTFYVGYQYWKRLERPEKAEMFFRKLAKAEEPTPYEAILDTFYVEFYTAKENWRRLEELLMKTSEEPEGDARTAAVRRSLARLAAERGKKDKAIAFWQGVRQVEPEDEEAEEALKTLYMDVQKWHSLIELHTDKLKRLPDEDVDAKVGLHLEMIDIFRDHIRSDTKISAAYQAILELQPDNAQALDALVKQYTEMKRWPDLVRTLQQKAEHTSDADALIALHREIASIMMEKFSNSTEAIKSYQAILELDPTDRDAIATLKDIYEKRRDYESYVEISLKEIEQTEDADERHAATIELATLAADRIRKPATAIELWSRVVAHDPRDAKALENLENLYERGKEYDQLVDILEKKLEITEDEADKLAILQKLALIYGAQIKDDERTVETWKRVLAIDPEDRKAQADLKKRFLQAGQWDDLEWFFRSFGTVEEYVRTIESQVKKLDDAADKIALLLKAAQVWSEELNNTNRAIRSLEAILAIDADNVATAEMLIPIYRQEQMWDRLPAVFEIQLAHTDDRESRRLIFLELAQILEEHLREPERAFFAYIEAFKENWSDDDIHAALERLAEISGNWDTYVAVLESTLEWVDDPAYRVRYLTRIAQVQENQLGNHEEALDWFLRVLDDDRHNPVALDAIEGLYRKMGRWNELIGILERKLEREEDPETRKEILFQLGSAWRDLAGDHARAVGVYEQMLEQFPDEVRVYEELSALFLAAADFPSLRDVLERKLALLQREGAEGPEVATLLCDLGMLTYATLDDMEGGLEAVIACYENALEADPTSACAAALLEELLASTAVRGRVARILEPVYRMQTDWAKLADVYEIRLAEMGAEASAQAQSSWLLSAGELYRDRLGRSDLAFRTFCRLFRVEPGDPSVRPPLEDLAGREGSWPVLVDLYCAEVDRIEQDSVRLDVLLRIAQLYHQELGNLESAYAYYNQVLALDSAHAYSLDALEEIYGQLGLHQQLLEVYHRKIELLEDPDERIRYLFAASRVWHDQLGNNDEAIAETLRVLDVEPSHAEALRQLDELYQESARWEDLADTLVRRIELATDTDEIVELKLRLAVVQESKVEDIRSAIETHASIIELQPENEAALGTLERLFNDPEWNPLIAPILEPHYRKHEDWERLIAVYLVLESSAEDDIERRVGLNFEISGLYETKLGDKESAFRHFAAAYRLQPERPETLENLLRLGDDLEAHRELVDLLAAHAEDVADSAQRLEIHRVAAQLSRDRCGDAAGAKLHYQKVLEIDADDIDALDALIELHRTDGEWETLVGVLMQRAPLTTDLADRKAMLREAGGLCARELDDSVRAIEIYEALRDLDPADSGWLDALEELYALTSNWTELVAVYTEKIARSEDLDEKKRYAREKARIHEEKQDALDDAIETYRLVLEWDADDLHALQMLDGLYTRREDWYSLLEVLDRQMALVGEEEQLVLRMRIGRLYESKLEDVIQAIEAYRLVLERYPGHGEALSALTRLVRESDARQRAFEVLRPVLADTGDWTTLLELYDVIASHEDDAFQKVALFTTMAAIAEERLELPSRAFDLYGGAFALDPERAETVAELERLAAANGYWERIVELYKAGAADCMNPETQLELRLKVGRFLRHEIIDLDRAVAHYSALQEDYPENLEILENLDRLHEDREEWGILADVLQREIEVHTELAQKIPLYFRLGNLVERHLDDPRRAQECYTEVLLLDRSSEEAIVQLERLYERPELRLDIADQLEPIYVERERWEALHRMLQLKLDVISEELDRLDLLRRLANLNLETLQRPADAAVWLGKAFVLDPEDDGMLAQLTDLVTESGAWAQLVDVLLEGALRVEEDDRKVELWHRTARILAEKLADSAQAEVIYKRILEVDEENLDAVRALDRIYAQEQRWDDLEAILGREIALEPYDHDRVGLLVRRAELYRDRLDRPDDAIRSFREVIEIEENHRPSLSALATIYEQREAWEDLFKILALLSEVAESDDERVRNLFQMSQIAETHLQQPKEAARLLEEVLTIRPDDLGAIRELERLMESVGDWTGFVETIERELRMVTEDQDRRLALYTRAGEIWRTQLDDLFQAQEAYQRALEIAPQDTATMGVLRELYRENEAPDALADILRRLIAAGTLDPDETAEAWRELADLKTNVIPNPVEAAEAWKQVLEVQPSDMQAVEALQRIYYEEGNWEPCVEILQRKVPLLDDPEAKVEALVLIANIRRENLGQTMGAASAYEEVLRIDPANLDASLALEKIYEESSDFDRLAQVLEQRAAHLTDEVEKVYLLQSLARLHEEKLEDRSRALEMLRLALRIEPSDPQSLAEMERLATADELWEQLHAIYEEIIPRLAEDDSVVEILAKSAVLLRDRLGRLEESSARFVEILERDPEHEESLRSLATLYEKQERWENMIDALGRLAEVAFDELEKVGFLFKIAETHEHRLGDRDAAIEAYKNVLEAEENHEKALAALERLYADGEQWQELVEILRREADLLPDREAELRLRVGELYEVRLDDVAAAILTYEDVLNFDPANNEALERLEALYGEREEWDKLILVYERLMDVAEAPEDRVRFCKNLAVLYEEASDEPEQAIEAYRRILELAPTNADALESLERLYTKEEAWEYLVENHLRWADLSETPDEKASRLVAAADVYAQQLEDVDNAIRTYERVLEVAPAHVAALDALVGLYREVQDWERVVDCLGRKAEALDDTNAAAAVHAERGDVLREEIENLERAADAYKLAFDLPDDPRETDVGDRYVGVLGELARWAEVIVVLRRLQQEAEEDTRQADLYCAMGEIYATKLDDRDGAVDSFERALEAVPDYSPALAALAALYMREEKWARAIPMLELQLEQTDPEETPDEAFILYRNMAIAARNVFEEDKAVEFFERAYELRPDDLDVLKGLSSLYFQRERYSEARRMYQEILASAEDSLEATDLVEIYKALGDTCLQLGERDEAGEYLEKVLLYQPDNPDAIEDLVRVYEAHEDWQGVIRYKQELCNAKQDVLERLGIQIEIGDIYHQRLGDLDAAVSAYREALSIRPDSQRAHIKLLEIFHETERYSEAIEILEALIRLADDNAQKASYSFTIALIYRDQLDDERTAVEFLNKTLDADPERTEAFAIIDEILTENKDWKGQTDAYRKMIQRIQGRGLEDLEFQLYRNLGEVYRSRIRNFEYAISAFALAGKLRPQDERVHEILSELYSFQGDYAKAIHEHETLLMADANRVESFRAIKQLALDMRLLDRGWAAAGVLSLLGKATAEERQFYKQHRARTIGSGRGSLDAKLWQQGLFTESTDYLVGQVFQVLYQTIGDELEAKDLKDLGLKRRDEVKPNRELMFNKVLRDVARGLGIAPPKVFLSERAVGVNLEGTLPPILVVGPDMLQGKTEVEMSFVLGKLLTYCHPMHILASVFSEATLTSLLQCAARYSYPSEFPEDANPAQADIVKQIRRKISQQLHHQLTNSMSQLRQAVPDPMSFPVRGWLDRVEHTANNAGLLACGDVEVAGRIISSETLTFSQLSARDKVKNLVLYAVSARYHELREHLGLLLE